MTSTSRVVLSVGSNLGDSRARLAEVVDALGDRLVAASGVFRTPPWGGVEQDDFLNQTLIAEAALTPREWLGFCREREAAAERVREVRWGPRSLDVDVVSVQVDGVEVVDDDPELTLPHPRAALRAFVLAPWLDVDPEAELWTPDGVRRVVDLLAGLAPDERSGVVRVEDS
ncbi:MAG: 2-amino-4-hydroxy-6-hydroxymethyldihydropteridine diphosphokinase [Gordonia sp. (in: high G+C Gram-positive bacteria)]|uniref:2-amino-4-hydroxy-6- hydroxymethyldihydropteridine diphosphokinase n=1 Tax=Gordonia sp. (in: high G+C Gram-positive bacteria) TaxID=84139 RepID=UPI0039E69341